jgi:hypothetical protein
MHILRMKANRQFNSILVEAEILHFHRRGTEDAEADHSGFPPRAPRLRGESGAAALKLIKYNTGSLASYHGPGNKKKQSLNRFRP